MMYRTICFIMLILLLVRPLFALYEQRGKFFSPGYSARYEMLKTAYYSSQYTKKENPSIIPDETFESFVGGAFLRGTNPILIVHEHPPMGRYIIALSILLFDNAATIMPMLLLISLVGIFLISRLVLKKTILALLPLVLFVNEPLFMGKLYFAPLLEPIQLPFIIFALYFFMRGVRAQKSLGWFILTSIMLGFVISIRFFILGAAEMSAMILYLLTQKHFYKKFFLFAISLPFSLFVLFVSYTRTIQDGYSLWQILGVQKYIFYYHQSKLLNVFSFWDLILFNRWHTWWADRAVISDAQWIITWPISMIATCISMIAALLKKIVVSEEQKILYIWIFVYCLLLSAGSTTTRYFLPLVPFLYIIAIDLFVRIVQKRV